MSKLLNIIAITLIAAPAFAQYEYERLGDGYRVTSHEMVPFHDGFLWRAKAAVTDPTLVMWHEYTTDPTNETPWTVLDSSQYSNIGTQTVEGSRPAWTNGVLQFDGVNDFYIVPNNATVSPSNALTITAWILLDTSSGIRCIAQKGWNNALQRGWLIQTANATRRLEWFCSESGGAAAGSAKSVSTVDAIPEDAWTHVAATFEGSSNMFVYVNGAPANVATNYTHNFDYIRKQGNSLNVGTFVDTALTFYFWSGGLDDVRLYDRRLSDSDIATLYNSTTNVVRP